MTQKTNPKLGQWTARKVAMRKDEQLKKLANAVNESIKGLGKKGTW